jgi:hypothetical protein
MVEPVEANALPPMTEESFPLQKAADIAARLGVSKSWVYRNLPAIELSDGVKRYRRDLPQLMAVGSTGAIEG